MLSVVQREAPSFGHAVAAPSGDTDAPSRARTAEDAERLRAAIERLGGRLATTRDTLDRMAAGLVDEGGAVSGAPERTETSPSPSPAAPVAPARRTAPAARVAARGVDARPAPPAALAEHVLRHAAGPDRPA